MSKALISVDVLGKNICAGIGDSTLKYHFAITRHILSTYKQLHLYVDHDFEVKTQILETSSVINCPCDFVYETKVGLMVNDRIAVLTLNKNLQTNNYSQTASAEELESIWLGNYAGSGYAFYNSFRNGEFLGDLLGYGAGFNSRGYYNIDKKEGTIQIGSLVPEGSEIVIEYKSDGISAGLKLIPSEMEDVISYGAKQRFYEDKRDIQWATYNKEMYMNEYNKVKKLYNFKSALYLAQKIDQSYSYNI